MRFDLSAPATSGNKVISMRIMSTLRSLLCWSGSVALLAISLSISQAQVVIGDWESGNDGWIDWSASQTPIDVGGPKFTLSPNNATLGSSSLLLTQTGWNQNLSIDLVANGHSAAFFENDMLLIDITYPASENGSYQQIYELAINAPNIGWTPSANPYPDTSLDPTQGPHSFTLEFDYSSYKATIGADPGYIQIILASNTDSTPGEFYFDNARLVPIPEPASAGLLAFGGLVAVILRRRLSAH